MEVQSIKLRNTGSSSVTYDLSTAWNSPAAGAVVSIWPWRVTVQAGHSRDVTVKVTIWSPAAAAFPAAQYDGSLFTLQGLGWVGQPDGGVCGDPPSCGCRSSWRRTRARTSRS